jgi:phage terminase large subunit-like protein
MATSATTSGSRGTSPDVTARPPTRDYAGIASQYAEDIVKDRMVACKWIKLACQRHLDDLGRPFDDEFHFAFDAELAARACSFKEKLPHIKGKWSRSVNGQINRMHLEPWQVFENASIYGWVDPSTRLRRFIEAYISVGRKNGKTADGAGDVLYLVTADDEPAAEVFCAANSLEQALLLFQPARMMAQLLPGLRRAYSLEIAKLSILRLDDGGRIRPLADIARDGSSPHGCLLDEYHEAETDEQYVSNQNGMMAREQPLLKVITTAGTLINGPCHNLENDAKRMLEGIVVNHRFFALIYTLDEGDDWRDLECLKKANPNYGVSVIPEIFNQLLRNAIQQPAKQPEFITKNANVWRNSGRQWISPEAWSKCADHSLSIDRFNGVPAFHGCDLAAKIDLASRCRIFRVDENGTAHYYIFWRHYVPEDRVIDGNHSHYQHWVRQQKMVAHPGGEIRLQKIQEEIEAEALLYPPLCIAFDQWNAKQMEQGLEGKFAEGVVIEIPQNAQFLSPAMVEVEAAVAGGRLHHDGDPVAAWAVSCVVVNELRNDNFFPDKLKNGRNKIDPVSALLNAMNRAMIGPAKRSVYATRGLVSL